jgi:hypothetical protein
MPSGATHLVEENRAEIGPYRDAGDLIETVGIEYDDWSITSTLIEKENSIQSGGS